MKNIIKILSFVLLLNFIQIYSQAQTPSACGDQIDFSWIKTAGGINDDQVNDITTDINGNIYITGYFTNSITFQTETVFSYGGKDFFIAKLDSDGNLLWIKTGGGVNDDFGTGIATDNSGNAFVTGTYNGDAFFDDQFFYPFGGNDIFLIKYSPDGDIMWKKQFGHNENDLSGGICVDNNENVIFTGSFRGSMSIGGTALFSYESDNFVSKYTNSGNALWAMNYSSYLDDYGIDVACDNNGNIFLLGEFTDDIYFDSYVLTSSGGKDIFLAKLNSSGYPQWAYSFGTTGINDQAGGITTDINNNVYICYKKDRLINVGSIEKYNNAGTNILSLEFGGNGDVFPKGIVVDNLENIYFTGMFSNSVDFGNGNISAVGGSDYFLTKFKPDGSYDYNHSGGSTSTDSGNSICIDLNNDIITGGLYSNGLNIGSPNQPSEGLTDLMVLKYKKYFSFGETMISSINCDPHNMCIDIQLIGGTMPFTYLWSTGDTTEDVCGISTGTHTIIVTDNNGCSIENIITVSAFTPPVISMPPSASFCPFGTVTLDAGAGFSSYLWSNSESTRTITVDTQGTYYVTVTDNNSCTASASVVVTKLPNQPFFTQDNFYFCSDDYARVTVTGFQQYLWSTGSTTPTLVTDTEGEYWLRVFDGNCHYYDTIEVIKYPPININLGNNVTICEGDSVLLTANPGYAGYLWSDNSTTNTFWAKTEGLVSVTVTDVNNCTAVDYVQVSLLTRPVVNIGNDTVVCTNTGLILNSNNPHPNTSYLWSTGSTGSSITIYNSGTYWLEATSNLGNCKAYDTINVVIYPRPQIDLGPDVEFCEGDSVKIEITDSYPSIMWSNNETGNTIYVYNTDTISVMVTDYNGCNAYDTINIFMNTVEYPFLGTDTTLCEGDIYELSPDGNYYSYSWNTGSNLPYIEITHAGFYKLTVYDSNGCSNSASINIDYQPKPIINDVEVRPGGVYIYAAEGTPPYRYSLDGSTWQNENAFFNFSSGNYIAYTMDDNYCTATMDIFIDVLYRIPSFFTPNGDGYNDRWEIEGLHHFPNAVVKIFDRFGKELYEFKSGTPGWDGTYMGKPVPSDSYWYTVDFGKKGDVAKGHVTIKR